MVDFLRHQDEEPVTIDAILDDRGNKYGNYLRQASIVEGLWQQLATALGGKTLAPDQADALRMICVKLSRIANGDPDYVDNWRDVAGYATLVADRLEGKSR